MKEKAKNQIFRADGKGKFVEVLNNCFDIGKVELGFRAYDVSRAKNDRFIAQIDIYMDIPVFLAFTQDVLSGRISEMLKRKPNEPAFVDMGGISAKTLAAREQSRPDHMCLSRQLKLNSGNSGFLMVAECGPGKESETGLIVPQYGTNPEQKVAIPFDSTTLKRMLLITQSHIQAFLNSKYFFDEVDARREKKLQQKAG